MPEKIAGLPAHPLIVHLPIVLGPLVGLLAILLLIPAWRDRLVWPTAALAVVFAVAAIAAVSSGEALARTLQIGDGIAEHADAARTLRLVALIFAVVLVVVASTRKKLPGLVQNGALVAVAALGVATIGFTIKTGHEGATAVWKSAYEAAEEASSGSDDAATDDSATEDEAATDDGGFTQTDEEAAAGEDGGFTQTDEEAAAEAGK